jgi:hypothetical protein
VNIISKILFWSVTILVGFVNPLFSVALVVLYYLPKVISDICQPCDEFENKSTMNSFSDDIMEEMK